MHETLPLATKNCFPRSVVRGVSMPCEVIITLSLVPVLDREVDFGVTLAVLRGQTDARAQNRAAEFKKCLNYNILCHWARCARPGTNPKSGTSAFRHSRV